VPQGVQGPDGPGPLLRRWPPLPRAKQSGWSDAVRAPPSRGVCATWPKLVLAQSACSSGNATDLEITFTHGRTSHPPHSPLPSLTPPPLPPKTTCSLAQRSSAACTQRPPRTLPCPGSCWASPPDTTRRQRGVPCRRESVRVSVCFVLSLSFGREKCRNKRAGRIFDIQIYIQLGSPPCSREMLPGIPEC
jgi:hypothetical protein